MVGSYASSWLSRSADVSAGVKAGSASGLSPDDVASLEAAVPASAVAGTRYDAHQMRALDSER